MPTIILEPELEKLFQSYKHSPGGQFLHEIVLGDPMYGDKFRFRGYNGPVDMLHEPKVAVKYAHQLRIPGSKVAHSQRADYFNGLANTMENEWQDVVSQAVKLYGKRGSLISGIYRDHFPEDIKDRLRFLTRGSQLARDAAHVHDLLSKSRSPYFH